MSLIDLAKVLNQAVTEIWVMGRVARKPSTTKAQTSLHSRGGLISDFIFQSLESISKSAKSSLTKTCGDRIELRHEISNNVE